MQYNSGYNKDENFIMKLQCTKYAKCREIRNVLLSNFNIICTYDFSNFCIMGTCARKKYLPIKNPLGALFPSVHQCNYTFYELS